MRPLPLFTNIIRAPQAQRASPGIRLATSACGRPAESFRRMLIAAFVDDGGIVVLDRLQFRDPFVGLVLPVWQVFAEDGAAADDLAHPGSLPA
jgi:hypothetical protein